MSAQPDETFLQRQLRLKRERDAAERLAAGWSPPACTDTTDASGLRNSETYGKAAVAKIAQRIADTPEGVRDETLNRELFNAGALLRDGVITHEQLADAVLEAIGDDDTWDHYKVREKIQRAPVEGASKRRDVDYGVAADDDWADLMGEGWTPPGQREEAAQEASGAVPDPEPPPEAEETAAERSHRRAVAQELAALRARDEAKRTFEAERAALTWRPPAYVRTLREELALPRESEPYAIDKLLPVGGNALLTAAFKAGKTTLITNLAAAWVDGKPFLGRFTVSGTRRVALWNYEVGRSQYAQWLEDMAIGNQDDITVLNLRGIRMPLTSARIEDWCVGWLKEHDIGLWVPDPYARAAVGTDENSNTEAGIWLDTVDVIKDRAGVSELVLPIHTGRGKQEQGEERARGATRLDDWADARWVLTQGERDASGQGRPPSFFRAQGRDIEVEEEMLSFEVTTRTLTMGGGDRRWVKNKDKAQQILDYVNSNPGSSQRQVQEGVGGNKTTNVGILDDLARRHKIRVEGASRGAGWSYFANDQKAW